MQGQDPTRDWEHANKPSGIASENRIHVPIVKMSARWFEMLMYWSVSAAINRVNSILAVRSIAKIAYVFRFKVHLTNDRPVEAGTQR